MLFSIGVACTSNILLYYITNMSIHLYKEHTARASKSTVPRVLTRSSVRRVWMAAGVTNALMSVSVSKEVVGNQMDSVNLVQTVIIMMGIVLNAKLIIAKDVPRIGKGMSTNVTRVTRVGKGIATNVTRVTCWITTGTALSLKRWTHV